MPNLGPNTNVSSDALRATMLLCAGEDRGELVESMRRVIGEPIPPMIAYRCYAFWSFPSMCVAWSGIGSGSLEPMLVEVLRANIVQRIILFGTAGLAEDASLSMGEVHAITEAYLAGTAFDGEQIVQPLRPRFDLPADVATARSVSSDFYYGFGPETAAGTYPFRNGQLQRHYHALRGKYDLVEMEVAQFYALCQAFGGQTLQYLAVKGPANPLGQHDQQTLHSQSVLDAAMALSLRLLGENIA